VGRGSAAVLLGESAAARHRRTGDGRETAAHRCGDGDATRRRLASGEPRETASDQRWWLRPVAVGMAALARRAVGAEAARARRSGGGWRGRCDGRWRAARGGCQDARCAVPTAALSHGVGAARGSHTAVVHCRVGPAWRAATDRSGPVVSDFRIKIHPEGN
jgi:hypothetical protein